MKKIKCVVWDLDNTIWKGILSENDDVILFDGIKDILAELDNRGIINSIASKNDYEA
jgi:HAD superfamily phosphatase (TIGR01681 family)